ncbi:MAG: YqgE/AlgH family protein [Pseudomonadales bacterium]|nr:YqgE/AlgH family protein [Pseudomonadales bacterium]
MSTIESFRNQFLVSMPSLKGDYFEDTISLMIDHNDEGAFGLIVNRLLKTRLVEIFPDVSGVFDCPVLEGGPVEQNRVFFLHEAGTHYESTLEVSDEVFLTTSADFIDAMKKGTAPRRTLALLGYAGWGSRQLEDEIATNAWLLTPANALIVFDTPFEDRTRAAAATLGVDLNLIAPSAGHD